MSERDDENPDKPSRDAPRREEHSDEAASGEAGESSVSEPPGDDSASGAREGTSDAKTQTSGRATEPEEAASVEIEAGRPPAERADAEGSEDAEPGREASDPDRSSDSADAETAETPEGLEESDELPEVPPWADDLPSLAGARPRRSAQTRPDKAKRKPRITARGAAYLGGGLGAAALVAWLVALSWANSSGYYVVCEPDAIRAERGRWLPWGRASMDGPKWEPIPIAPDGDCAERELETEAELAERFASALLERSSAILAGEEDADLAVAERQLEQAMLLSRGRQSDAAREEIGRLRGDLAYLRAVDELDAAIEQVDAAAETFSEAAERDPRHHEDADAWAEHTRDISEALRAGPGASASKGADAEARAAEATASDADGDAPTLGPDPAEGSAAAENDSTPSAPAGEGGSTPSEGEGGGAESYELEEDLPEGGVLL